MNSRVSNSPVRGRLRPLIGLLLVTVLLGACRVDNVVTLTVKPNGSGTVAVVTTVDAEIVANYPNLANDLSFDDAKAAGWKVSEVASCGLLNACDTRTCTPPVSVGATSDTFQPAALASSKLRSLARLG